MVKVTGTAVDLGYISVCVYSSTVVCRSPVVRMKCANSIDRSQLFWHHFSIGVEEVLLVDTYIASLVQSSIRFEQKFMSTHVQSSRFFLSKAL